MAEAGTVELDFMVKKRWNTNCFVRYLFTYYRLNHRNVQTFKCIIDFLAYCGNDLKFGSINFQCGIIAFCLFSVNT